MTRQHPAHDTVAALTRQQRTTIEITPTVRYRVTAPCLLAQLHSELGSSDRGTGGRTTPGSRPVVAIDALGLWQEILHNTHSWAAHLQLDRRPYLTDDDQHHIPPVGRLLRHVTATATGRGLDPIADAIHRSATRWRTHIEQMLHDVQPYRGIRGATCPHCNAQHVTENRDDPPGTYRIPAIVLATRDIAGETLRWLTCQACGWTVSADGYAAGLANYWLRTITHVTRTALTLAPPPRRKATA